MRPARRSSAVLALVAASACAQISAETRVHTQVRADAPALARRQQVAARKLEVRYVQRGGRLDVAIVEHRACRELTTVAAVREERTVRRADAMIYWEYAVAGVALGVAALAFARPEGFSTVKPEDGVLAYDVATGHRLGGVFTAIGSAALIGGIVDSVRARDKVRRIDTTVTREGPLLPCAPPVITAGDRPVALVLGEQRVAGVTDEAGEVRFELPAEPPAPADAATLPAALHVGPEVLPLTLVAPYARTADAPHAGVVTGGER